MEKLSTLAVSAVIIAISFFAIKRIRKNGGCSCGEKSCKSSSCCYKQENK
ncbi:MAG: hypothetical protein Q4D53_07445 [Leptotrichiaceae bacterium]|nr:hypothetical protein [Leptotrichiaceae bacterium]